MQLENRFDSDFMAKLWRILVALLAVGLIAGLLLACSGGGKHEAEKVREARIEASPRKAETTAGRELPLKFNLYGLTSQDVRWTVLEPNGGQVTPAGVYAAPAKEGVYHVNVQSLVAPHAMDTAEIKVHPQPVAESLTPDRKWVRPGGSCTLTAVFHGGEGVVQPGGIRMESGVPKSFTPGRTTEYVLRVSNPLGVIAERTAKVDVAAALVQMRDINAPEVVRVGNFHVAWVERRVGAQLEWSSDDVIFLGGQDKPTTPVVVFTPRENAQEYQLRVKAVGGEDLEPAGETPGPLDEKALGRKAEAPAADEAVFTFKGKVEKPSEDQPVITLDAPYLSAGKAGCKARVGNPRTGTRYAWKIRHGAFKDGAAAGPEVEFATSRADYLLLTCEATTEATGTLASTTTAVLLVPPPLPPVINTEDHPVARMVEWAYVKDVKGGEKYRWEIAKEGTLGDGGQTAAAPLVKYRVLNPGTCVLKCWAENLAGDKSEPSVRTLSAVGPFVLDPPKLKAEEIIKANSGPYPAEVLGPVPGLQYQWSGDNCQLASSSGASIAFESKDKILLLKCTATEPTTGKTSHASLAREVVFAPGIPEIVAPHTVEPGKPYVAAVKLGGRPDLTYRWELDNGTLDPAAKEDRRVIAPFTAGKVIGDYKLTLWARNRAGEESSEGATFTGKVKAPPSSTGSDPSGSGTKDPDPSGSGTTGAGSKDSSGKSSGTAMTVTYKPGNFEAGTAIPDQLPDVTNAGGPATFAVTQGMLPPGLALDAVTGVISGTPTASSVYPFMITAASGSASANCTVTYVVAGADALGLSYPAPPKGQKTREAIPVLAPVLTHATPSVPTIFSWTGKAPAGLELDPLSGAISGTPYQDGTFTFKVQASNWNRKAEHEITLTVVPGPPLELDYPDRTFDMLNKVEIKPVIRNDSTFPFKDFTLAEGSLPPGMEIGSAGEIKGKPGQIGSWEFKILVTCSNFDNPMTETATTRLVKVNIIPFKELKLEFFKSDQPVLEPGEKAQLSWDFTGIPASLSLTRNLLGVARKDTPEAMRPNLPVTVEDRSLSVPVTRRQEFTLTLANRTKGKKPEAGTVKVGTRGVELVAGVPGWAPREYAQGNQGQARVREVKGLAYHDGSLYLSEGSDQTIRKFTPGAKGAPTVLFRGVPRGPDVEMPSRARDAKRLHQPEALAVAGDQLVIADNGTHTLKVTSFDAKGECTVLAGTRDRKGGIDGLPGTGTFGTIADLAVAGNVVYVADRDHGIRMVKLDTGEIRTMKATGHGARKDVVYGHGYPHITVANPVGITALSGSSSVQLLVTPAREPDWLGHPGGMSKVNSAILRVRPSDPGDLWGGAWIVERFAGGMGPGFQDGPGLPKFNKPETGAFFSGPAGMAQAGNSLVVADTRNDCLRLVDLGNAEHPVALLAGKYAKKVMQQGREDHSKDPLEATLRQPTRVVRGKDDKEVWFLDNGHLVRRLTFGGKLPEAGAVATAYPLQERPGPARDANGKNLPLDGPGSRARFNRPLGVAVNMATGDAFIADAGHAAIRKVLLRGDGLRPAGTVTTYAGQLGAPGKPGEEPEELKAARFQNLSDLGVDSHGRLYLLQDAGERIRVLDGTVWTLLDNLSCDSPKPSLESAKHPTVMAVRSAGADPQMLALAEFLPPDATAGHPARWRITLHRISPKLDPVSHLPVAGEVVRTSERVVELSGNYPVRALAVGLDDRIRVLVERGDAQKCTVRTFQWDPLAHAWQEAHGTPPQFGPGTTQGTDFGMPDVRGMATDSQNNIFLTDAANGLVWMIAASDQAVLPLVGTAGTLLAVDEHPAQPFGTPLAMPTGIAVTPEDDLIVACGEALVQVTAPGTKDHPWQEPAKRTVLMEPGKGQTKDQEPEDPKEAQAKLNKAIHDAKVLSQAQADRKAWKLKEAVTGFNAYLLSVPGHKPALKYLGMTAPVIDARAAKAAGDFAAARTNYETYFKAAPPSDCLWATLRAEFIKLLHDEAKARLAAGAPEAAQDLFEACLAQYSTDYLKVAAKGSLGRVEVAADMLTAGLGEAKKDLAAGSLTQAQARYRKLSKLFHDGYRKWTDAKDVQRVAFQADFRDLLLGMLPGLKGTAFGEVRKDLEGYLKSAGFGEPTVPAVRTTLIDLLCVKADTERKAGRLAAAGELYRDALALYTLGYNPVRPAPAKADLQKEVAEVAKELLAKARAAVVRADLPAARKLYALVLDLMPAGDNATKAVAKEANALPKP